LEYALRYPERLSHLILLDTAPTFDYWEEVKANARRKGAGYEEMGRRRILEETGISEDRLDVALTYYRAYKDEVNEKIQENSRPLQYWRECYPNLNIQTIEH
jgi:pimeloyl-ACP methyl ester carboxylesterase